MYNILLEESIMQRDIPCTAGSKMLANFIAPFDATVAVLLQAAGVRISGRVITSEFGVGGLFADQPGELTVSVNSFATGEADAMLCNDYTGAIAAAAGNRGLCYIHPTYGTVSRHGLIPSVTSIDQIGVLCRDVKTGFEIINIISGKNINPTRQKTPVITKTHQPYYDIYPQIMQILCCAELANNISRYDGIKFGYRAKDYNNLDELYTKSRTGAFGENIKLSALIGAMVLSKDNYNKYYDKAMRLRRMIKNSLDFSKAEVLTATENQESGFPVLSRLCGLPSLTTPKGTFIANTECEDLLYEV